MEVENNDITIKYFKCLFRSLFWLQISHWWEPELFIIPNVAVGQKNIVNTVVEMQTVRNETQNLKMIHR